MMDKSMMQELICVSSKGDGNADVYSIREGIFVGAVLGVQVGTMQNGWLGEIEDLLEAITLLMQFAIFVTYGYYITYKNFAVRRNREVEPQAQPLVQHDGDVDMKGMLVINVGVMFLSYTVAERGPGPSSAAR
eukprot:TRINITY_DN2794_c1_g2_i4.p2 TRINITY_DN2794_c1_g2~~TRINITY_DN2794_c1_g2_i4.p2  ORF type:complete len:133 (-),score=22.32 TRINITY_DN2794_c1_g2_i4:207-605(-)